MARDQTRAKEKARAENDGQDSEEDAYGSDDPDHQNPSQEPELDAAPVDGQDGEVDGLPQGSPKGYKRSRINSAGQGAPVEVKTEKIKTLFEPLVRDTDGYVRLVLPFVPLPSPSFFKTQVMSQVPLSAFNYTTS